MGNRANGDAVTADARSPGGSAPGLRDPDGPTWPSALPMVRSAWSGWRPKHPGATSRDPFDRAPAGATRPTNRSPTALSWLSMHMAARSPAGALTEPTNQRDLARYQALPARVRATVRRRANDLRAAGTTPARAWAGALNEAASTSNTTSLRKVDDTMAELEQLNITIAGDVERLGATPLGAAEIAKRLGVERSTVDMWSLRQVLPSPTWVVGGRKAWATKVIDAWAQDTGRTPA